MNHIIAGAVIGFILGMFIEMSFTIRSNSKASKNIYLPRPKPASAAFYEAFYMGLIGLMNGAVIAYFI